MREERLNLLSPNDDLYGEPLGIIIRVAIIRKFFGIGYVVIDRKLQFRFGPPDHPRHPFILSIQEKT